jgi:hypothetical protein
LPNQLAEVGELFASDLSRGARYADGRHHIAGVVEKRRADASAPDLSLLVFNRVASMPDLRHLLFEPADRGDGVFVVTRQTSISHQTQKLVFPQMRQKTLADGLAVQFETFTDPGGQPHKSRRLNLFDQDGFVALDERHVYRQP